ncbi:hypothetical protein COCCADRAFT_3548 [Bipolaris zeicola 26-R-13]|uniref:Uncharacterized protein n=1 Tax=Cochliobolus carbonum (strain 26-R-13) TaxID=930089 RepID=W6YUF6_COCC2|nr:uncharacterized protein COCCADRAFT_3548 [Bipolaris zeicola 26-R-13]EUC35146.1 hypothetical protein COCCADRAFT_3548 [Bipolaris zeicola 26-R-13]
MNVPKLPQSESDEISLDQAQAKSLRQHGGAGVHAHQGFIWALVQELELRTTNRQLHAQLELF